jgi:hypothetical protein
MIMNTEEALKVMTESFFQEEDDSTLRRIFRGYVNDVVQYLNEMDGRCKPTDPAKWREAFLIYLVAKSSERLTIPAGGESLVPECPNPYEGVGRNRLS